MSDQQNVPAVTTDVNDPLAKVPKESALRGRAAKLLERLGRWLDREQLPDTEALGKLYTASSKDNAANDLARQWADRYLAADADERRSLLAALVRAGIESDMSQKEQFFRRLYAQSDRLGLMVELRADMLRWRNQVAGLSELEQPLARLLSNWFDVGMLELRHINWDSPASLLEKLIKYEAVHEIRSWDDMRRRVADDRRCYAFFHPRMSDVPLIFVEVAFSEHIAGNVQALLDPVQPVGGLEKSRWAIFYSITNTQPGLRGISFGNFLLRRVIDDLQRELPHVRSYATLSPIPGFVSWLEKQSADEVRALLERLSADTETGVTGADWVARLRTEAAVTPDGDAAEGLRRVGLRLAARYLTALHNDQPVDPVARFHLGNGARIEHVNWAANLSVRGLTQSCGMMVNYMYEPTQLDENRAHLAAGKPSVSRKVQRL
ncbi:MAG: malonyl-CoA decarboxylase [Castellaniella sp.]|uniref:malonyl-CoA decarboxylase domain-containing protein n=1 Tax=Castellaniella sp. TaxID=1955812 RepID=UPI0011FBA037|nr:malonyl-CoA decarboxylase family protein [Castellaniella sp.]TAN30226.1 MAG: malonyl-CoA decarboxylase [Castellaniella sp.]